MSAPCRLLASVCSATEAAEVWPLVDLVDAKDPRQGALGALPVHVLRDIVRVVDGRRPVSATTGDLPLQADRLAAAMQQVADAGVDYVKVGLFGPVDPAQLAACLQALPALRAAPGHARPAGRIAVLMADQDGVRWPLHLLAAAGFAGVMLDTADKQCGGLRAVLDAAALEDFVQRARGLGLLCGLAGSLQLHDIAPLRTCAPDYLGFRTALCAAGARSGAIAPAQVAAVAQAVRAPTPFRQAC